MPGACRDLSLASLYLSTGSSVYVAGGRRSSSMSLSSSLSTIGRYRDSLSEIDRESPSTFDNDYDYDNDIEPRPGRGDGDTTSRTQE